MSAMLPWVLVCMGFRSQLGIALIDDSAATATAAAAAIAAGAILGLLYAPNGARIAVTGHGTREGSGCRRYIGARGPRHIVE